jgi:hypothetical protein
MLCMGLQNKHSSQNDTAVYGGPGHRNTCSSSVWIQTKYSMHFHIQQIIQQELMHRLEHSQPAWYISILHPVILKKDLDNCPTFSKKIAYKLLQKIGYFHPILVQYHIVFHFFSFKTMLYVSNYKYPSIHLYLGISIRRQGVIIYNWIQVRHNKSLLSIGWSNCINKMMKQKFKIIMYNRQISYLVSILQQTS